MNFWFVSAVKVEARMRILQVIPSVGPLRGGPSEHIRLLCGSLSRLGVEVTLATTDDNGPYKLEAPFGSSLEDEGYEVIYFPRQVATYTVSLPFASWIRKNLSGYQCLHIHSVFGFLPTVAAHHARKMRTPYVLSTHGILGDWGVENRRRFAKKVSILVNEGRMLRDARAVIFNSNKEREETLRKIGGINATVVPHGLDLGKYSELKGQGLLRKRYPQIGSRKVVLFLSRIHENKGLELLMQAFAALKMQDTVLVIAGEGDEGYMASLKSFASELGIEVIWTGFLAGDEKATALADADLYVLPSYSESFGISVIEAMASGIPVLISDQVGVHDEVSRAGAGMVVPCDAVKLAEAMRTLMDDSMLREKMGAAGRQLVEKKFTMESVALETLRIYQTIVDGA